MSETTAGQVGEPLQHDETQVSDDDIRRMLDEQRSEAARLKQELADERRQRQTVERDRDSHAARVVSETEQRYNAELHAVSTAHSSANSELASAKAAYRTALQDGEHDKAADLQELIARATYRREQAESYKSQLEKSKDQILRQQPVQSAVERVAGVEVLPQEKAWLASRGKFETDAAYRNDVIRASGDAVQEGCARGSAAYFRRMEEILGEGRNVEQPEREEAPARRPSADVSPTRRSQPGAAPAGRVRVELSADQREVADALFGNPTHDGYEADEGKRYEKYFNSVQNMKRSGRL